MVRPGDSFTITFVNLLGDDAARPPVDGHNMFRDPNVTNLHTHGLHESPTDPADNVLVQIEPGGTRTYKYSIPNDHAPGLFWCKPATAAPAHPR